MMIRWTNTTVVVVTMVLLSSTHVHTFASDDDAVAATTR